jgi:hypothetical protein
MHGNGRSIYRVLVGRPGRKNHGEDQGRDGRKT